MQTIEINTSQNVSISYEIASTRERITAYIIDLAIILGVAFTSSIFTGVISGSSSSSNLYIFYLIIAPIFIFYSLISEIITNGESIGKKAMNIKAVKLNGKEPQTDDFVMRWVFRMLDIYLSVGSLAIIFISSSRKGQRLGDIIAETSVIKIKPSKSLSLSDILKISSLDNYQIQYPDVRNFSEDDMLLIKNSLERSQKYKNNAHKEALALVSKRVQNVLGIDLKTVNDEEFLNTILKDYVVSTR